MRLVLADLAGGVHRPLRPGPRLPRPLLLDPDDGGEVVEAHPRVAGLGGVGPVEEPARPADDPQRRRRSRPCAGVGRRRESTLAVATGRRAAGARRRGRPPPTPNMPGQLAQVADGSHSSARSASVTPGTRRLTSRPFSRWRRRRRSRTSAGPRRRPSGRSARCAPRRPARPKCRASMGESASRSVLIRSSTSPAIRCSWRAPGRPGPRTPRRAPGCCGTAPGPARRPR